MQSQFYGTIKLYKRVFEVGMIYSTAVISNTHLWMLYKISILKNFRKFTKKTFSQNHPVKYILSTDSENQKPLKNKEQSFQKYSKSVWFCFTIKLLTDLVLFCSFYYFTQVLAQKFTFRADNSSHIIIRWWLTCFPHAKIAWWTIISWW